MRSECKDIIHVAVARKWKCMSYHKNGSVSSFLFLVCVCGFKGSQRNLSGDLVKEMEISSKKNIIPEFSEDEEALIDRMFNLLGRRWALIAGRIPGRTSEEIEHYCTSRKSPEAKRKLMQEVKELIPDSLSSNEEEGNMSDTRHLKEIRIGSYTPEFKPVLEKIGTYLAGQYKTETLAAADLQNETQLNNCSEKSNFITEHVESSSRKVAKQTIFLNQSDFVSGTKSTDVAQRVRVPAHRVTARKLMLRHNDDVLKSEKESLCEDKGQLLIDVEAEKAAKAEAAKTAVMDIKADRKEELENMQRKISDLFKFVEAHAEECAHFAVKLKEWTG